MLNGSENTLYLRATSFLAVGEMCGVGRSFVSEKMVGYVGQVASELDSSTLIRRFILNLLLIIWGCLVFWIGLREMLLVRQWLT